MKRIENQSKGNYPDQGGETDIKLHERACAKGLGAEELCAEGLGAEELCAKGFSSKD